ncbi:MAG TPA: hypothetical protein VF092_19910 [Longimicrobium sp.]
MRLHSIAAAALVALAACGDGGTPVSVEARSLAGSWKTDVAIVHDAVTPDGNRDLERTETWTFEENGRYVRQALQYDPLSGRSYTEYFEDGIWGVQPGHVLALRPERQFFALRTWEPSPDPVLQPASGFTFKYSYGIQDDVLNVTWPCSGGFQLCVFIATGLHRVQQQPFGALSR